MASSTNLFRNEALEAAHSQLGSPVRAVGVASWALTLFLLTLFAAVAVFLVTARYARKETVTGVLTPAAGALRVSADRPGVIQTVHVREGELVSAGAPLVTLSLDRTTATGESMSSLLAEAAAAEAEAARRSGTARSENIRSRLAELGARREGLQADIVRLDADRTLQLERVRLAEQSVEAARALYDKRLIAALPFRQREEALLAARQGLGSIDRERTRNGAALAQADAEAARLAAESAESRAVADVAEAQLAEKRAQLAGEAALVLVARKAGRIAALQAREGAPVQPGGTVAVVLPEGSGLEAELWVPSRAVGFVRPGNTVRLMYDAFPYQRFGVGRGVVRDVGRTPVQPQDLPVPMEAREGLYRVAVRLDRQDMLAHGGVWPLGPGMRLSADLVLENRSLWDWLLEPVQTVRKRAERGQRPDNTTVGLS